MHSLTVNAVQRCELFLKECEDGFHGSKDLGILHGLRGQGRYAGSSDHSAASGATSVSRRLRSYLPSKRRLPPPIEKCVAFYGRPKNSDGACCIVFVPHVTRTTCFP